MKMLKDLGVPYGSSIVATDNNNIDATADNSASDAINR